VPGHTYAEPAVTVLLVCTGNICRSALAERLGRAYLDDVLGDDAAAIRLGSAGSHAVVDSAMHPDSALVLQGYGAEPGDFRARRLTEAITAEADLTLTMTRAHRAEVLRLAPRALARTFTIREAAALLADVDEPEGASLPERVRALVDAMAAARAGRSSGADDDDVVDPIDRPVEVHEEAGELIAAALIPVLARLAALVADGTPSTVLPVGDDSRGSLDEHTARIAPQV